MRLVIVSNRLPFTVAMNGGAPCFRVSSGGLTSGLASYLDQQGNDTDYLWIGWPGSSIPSEQQPSVRDYGERHRRAVPVFLSDESANRFYLGFCNRTIWPLFHYRPSLVRYEEEYWEEYESVKESFCEAV
jgi:trehalose 6-phosphate synthase/phosphatase